MLLMEVLKSTRLDLWLMSYPRKRERAMKTCLLPFPGMLPLDISFLLLLLQVGNYMKWMSRMHFLMGALKRKFIMSNLKALRSMINKLMFEN